jgi:hypothetical protein
MDTAGVSLEAEAVGGPNSNNTQATAVPLAFGQVGKGNVTLSNGTDPSDWWGPIVIGSPSTITYQTRRGATATPILDTTINLRDSAGNIVLPATNGNVLDQPAASSGLHGRAMVSIYLAPSTYYLEVVSPGTTATTQQGDYELELSEVIAAPYVTATYATFAANAGCGTAPIPTLTRQFAAEVPATGTLFSRQLTNMTPSFVGLHVLGFSNPAALDLAIPFGGTPGACFLNVSPDIVNTVVTDAVGAVELQLLIPGSTAIRGFVLWEQGIDLDASAPNGFALQPGNYGRIIVGERTF